MKNKNIKIANLILLTLLLAGIGSVSFGLFAEQYLPKSISSIVSFIFAIYIGMKSRSIVESIVGYTLYELVVGTNSEENKED